jgi:uncharacterized repeat protein (TIGR01451 family)
MHKRKTESFPIFVVGLLLIFAVIMAPNFQSNTSARAEPQNPKADDNTQRTAGTASIKNYDLRYDPVALANYNQKLSPEVEDRTMKARQAMNIAKDELSQRIPDLKVEFSEILGSPKIVGVNPSSRNFLTRPSNARREEILRNFMADNKALFGFTAAQLEQLKKTADYTNPDGNMSWVTLEQEIKGIPVFRCQLKAAFTRQGELVQIVSELLPVLDYGTVVTTPLISAANAVISAAKAIGVEIDPNSLTAKSSQPDGRTFLFDRGPFVRDVKVELQLFPVKPGVAVSSWAVSLWQDVLAYYIIIDAETGQLLFLMNMTNNQTQSATYLIYNDDSPGPFSPTMALPGSQIQGPGILPGTSTLISELPAFDNLGWITDGGNTTTGNNVDAGLDVDGINGIDPKGRATGSPNRVFSFVYNPPPLGSDSPTNNDYGKGVVTNLFFWANRYHDRLYQLGFTEQARNFQKDNFTRGGVANDAISLEVQDTARPDMPNFTVYMDGEQPRCQMSIFNAPTPKRDSGLDADLFLHEFTHGVSRRLHGNATGLMFAQGKGMGEGWSDFYARCLLSSASENVDAVYAVAAYSSLNFSSLGTDNYYYGLRRFPYAVKKTVGGMDNKPHNPLTLKDVDPAQLVDTDGAYQPNPIGFSEGVKAASEPHNVGEIWCMALLEVRARIIKRMGYLDGNQRILQIVTNAMKMDPADPTLLDGRDTIITIDNASFGGEDVADIWAGFAERGFGLSATVSAASSDPITVTEAYDTPPADLAITKTASSPAIAGNNLTYTLTVRNNGPKAASSILIKDFLPANAVYVSSTGSPGVTFDTSQVNESGRTLICKKPSMALNETATVTIVVKICPEVSCNTSISNTATVSSDTTDLVPGNNSAVSISNTQAQSDLSITKTGPTIVVSGCTVTYTLNVSNTGPSNSASTTVIDSLPTGWTILSITPSQGTFSGVGTGTATINLGTLGAPNQCATNIPVSATVVIVVQIPMNQGPGSIVNTASVSSGNCLPDFNPINNTAAFTSKIFDISIQDETNAGSQLIFRSDTGEYLFCCGGSVSRCGTATLRKKGSTITLEHFALTHTVSARVDMAVKQGVGALKSPNGNLICTLTDRNITDNATCACASAACP